MERTMAEHESILNPDNRNNLTDPDLVQFEAKPRASSTPRSA
jgi:hypothetical protein